MMDGRVKTLHPQDPRRHPRPAPRGRRPGRGRAAHGIGLIDVVVVNLYPFARTAADPAAAFDDLVEQIDIGGPEPGARRRQELPRRARRGRPRRLPGGARRARRADGRPPALRFDLARRAFAHTAAYDTTIAPVLDDGDATTTASPIARSGAAGARPPRRRGRQVRDLRYGENPHQPAAWYAVGDGPGSRRGRRRAGQGAVLHQPARPRRGGAHRAGVRRAGRVRHQAHQSVRRGDRRDDRRGLRRARATPTRSRPSAASSASTGRSTPTRPALIVDDVHRSGRGARRWTTTPGPMLAAKPNMRVLVTDTEAFRRPAHGRPDARSALGARRAAGAGSATPSTRRSEPWPYEGVRVVSAASADAPRNGRRCALPGGSAPT